MRPTALLFSLFCLAGCDRLAQHFDAGFAKTFVPEATRTCTEEAVKGGADAETVKPLCRCIVTALTEQQSGFDLARVLILDAEGPEFQEMIAAASADCTPQTERAET
ncbi:MAG: hypothetical protein AAF515_15335 [Pseudomonadota bacterium]